MEKVLINSERWFSRQDLKGELWKSIKDYEGLYEVSNFGRIRSVDRYVEQQGRMQLYKGCLMSPFYNNSGYVCIRLSKNNKKHNFTLHRLVAIAFLPNPNNLPCINHIDESHDNNCIDNLEWCDQSYNQGYGSLPLRRKLAYGTRIAQYDLNGKYIRDFLSAREAEAEIGINHTQIVKCCKGLYHSAGGFIWREYDGDNQKIITPTRGRNSKRRICQYDKDLNLIAIFNSTREAERLTGCHHNYISYCCSGKINEVNGYIWRYKDE